MSLTSFTEQAASRSSSHTVAAPAVGGLQRGMELKSSQQEGSERRRPVINLDPKHILGQAHVTAAHDSSPAQPPGNQIRLPSSLQSLVQAVRQSAQPAEIPFSEPASIPPPSEVQAMQGSACIETLAAMERQPGQAALQPLQRGGLDRHPPEISADDGPASTEPGLGEQTGVIVAAKQGCSEELKQQEPPSVGTLQAMVVPSAACVSATGQSMILESAAEEPVQYDAIDSGRQEGSHSGCLEDQAAAHQHEAAPSAAAAVTIQPRPAAAPPVDTSLRAAQLIASAARQRCDVLKGPPRSSKEDPAFQQTFFAASRLHFIGSWKARIEALAASMSNDAPRATAPPRGGSRSIIHIDMDCFFAAVAGRAPSSFPVDPLTSLKCIVPVLMLCHESARETR